MTTEMTEVRGHFVPLTVVAAKKPEHWIVRGWMPFTTPDELREAIEQIVGRMDPEIEWTTWTYELPACLVYGGIHASDEEQVLEGWGWPKGIYKFPYGGGPGKYKGPVEQLRYTNRPSLHEIWQRIHA